MLQAMRDKATGILGWVVIGLIIVTFALFGLGSYLQDKARTYAARVNDVEITPREFQTAYQQQRAQMENRLGDAFDPSRLDEGLLRKSVLDSLIQNQLIIQQSEADGMTVSDQFLANMIHSIPDLQEDGVFSADRYKRVLISRGVTPTQFEADIRSRLLSSQLLQGLSKTTFVTDHEVRDIYKLQNQKRDFDYLTVSHTALLGDIQISTEEAETYFNDHSDLYMEPEKVRLASIRLSKADLADGIEIDATTLQSYYDEKKQSLLKQEQRRASHILIQVSSDADDADVVVAENKADDLLEKIRGGESFSELAKNNSDDPGSAEQGGDLGFFASGSMVPEFDEAVFSMQAGDISDVIRSQFGFHIIKLVEIKESKIPSFEEAKADLEKELKNSEAEDIYYSQIEQLTDLAFENPESLQPAADALGLTIEQSEWLWKDNPEGLGSYPKVMSIAFSQDVLEGGNNSEPIEISSDEAVVVRVIERQPEQQKKFDAVVSELMANLKAQKSSELAKEKGEALLQQVRDGTALKQLEKADELTVTEARDVTLASQGQNQYVLKNVFTLPEPAADTPVIEGFHLVDGDYVIVKLKAVRHAESEKIPETDSVQLRRSLENVRQTTTLSTLIDYLRDKAEIDIPESTE